jgi:cytochrome c oxidase subunit 2
MFAPVSPPAETILELSWLVFAISAAIFLTVAGILVFCILRYRARPGEDREPAQIYGSNQIELAWTLVPTLIVLVLFLATARTINELDLRKPLPGSLGITVVGHQWWWEIRYPELGIATANELHVPVSSESASRPTFLTLESVDVIHSFWVPQLAGKMDVVPNRSNYLWFAPTATGTFLGQCAEYCGTQHAHMLLRVIVHTPEDFDAWVASQKRPEVVEASVAEGRQIFEATACINCHTLGGTQARGTFGPDLTHLMSRETIGAGVAANTFENLRSWVLDPSQLKPGVLMPAMKLSDDEVDKLTRFLVSLK